MWLGALLFAFLGSAAGLGWAGVAICALIGFHVGRTRAESAGPGATLQSAADEARADELRLVTNFLQRADLELRAGSPPGGTPPASCPPLSTARTSTRREKEAEAISEEEPLRALRRGLRPLRRQLRPAVHGLPALRHRHADLGLHDLERQMVTVANTATVSGHGIVRDVLSADGTGLHRIRR